MITYATLKTMSSLRAKPLGQDSNLISKCLEYLPANGRQSRLLYTGNASYKVVSCQLLAFGLIALKEVEKYLIVQKLDVFLLKRPWQ